MVTRSEAIKAFLIKHTHPDLSILYNLGMECQVNVAKDNGERIEGEYKDKKWNGFTDSIEVWKSFRIPYKANTEPEYIDRTQTFSLDTHVEAIGMTGWDWARKKSIWVAYDFDAIIGHSAKSPHRLSETELLNVREAACSIPWVTVRNSTSGTGLHIYVFLDEVDCENHTEHSALGRAILGKMSALTGFDFHNKVDICGGNMWVWHRKMARSSNGLSLIKQGVPLGDIPSNWRDHKKVVTGRRERVIPEEIGNTEAFDELIFQKSKARLDTDHKKLISFLEDTHSIWWYDQDSDMLVTHTTHLKEAHVAMQLKGIFETSSTHSSPHNCFCFPIKNGGWSIRRYSMGVNEHPFWNQDGSGWTHCFYNVDPDLQTASRMFKGVEDVKKGFIFKVADNASNALKALGVEANLPPAILYNQATIKEHTDGRLLVTIDRGVLPSNLPGMEQWVENPKNWTRLFMPRSTSAREPDNLDFDNVVRHLITQAGDDYGWRIHTDGRWHSEPVSHLKMALKAKEVASKDIDRVLGTAVIKYWTVVNQPFKSEYPGDRCWNINSAQYSYPLLEDLDDLKYPTWLNILNHCGKSLDFAVKNNSWCAANEILTGADYLKCWIASSLQSPLEPLPYLFFYGPQNSGKSIFHEALSLLITTGCARADVALTSQASFNGELEHAVYCVVEETNLSKNSNAYNRIKDWVTSKEVLLHPKNATPYQIPNSTHWIQCANDIKYCPVFAGDTRITMIYVDTLDPIDLIPKKRLLERLRSEAQAFLTEVLNIELPETNDRLNIPVLETSDKHFASKMNQTLLENFILDEVIQSNGDAVLFSVFYDTFVSSIPLEDRNYWTKQRTAKELPLLKGKSHRNNHTYVANIKLSGVDSFEHWSDTNKIICTNGLLELTP